MGRSYTYDYDDAGNRIQKKEFAFTLGALGSDIGVYEYSYSSSGWRDRLTYDDGSYGSISYDAIGNPISIEDSDDPDICTSLRWKGRLLMSFSDSEGPSVSFSYNADGIRTSKTVGGIKHKYTLDGSRIVSEVWTKNGVEYFLYFIYDENGSPAGIEYRTSEYEDGEFDYYFFDKNIFGDIIGIYNESGRKICTYTYNAWGECSVDVIDSASLLELHLANEYNPFRYRGYYYDIETRYYYLQTRYYNPEWGRFLNADKQISGIGKDMRGYNMFSYCFNNPVNMLDSGGNWPRWITAAVAKVSAAATVVSMTAGATAVTMIAATATAVSTLAYVAQSHHYDKRKAKNTDLPQTAKEAEELNWKNSNPKSDLNPNGGGPAADCHQYTSPDKSNVKYVSPDGYREAIYNSEGNIVLDSRDVGTYNFSPSGTFIGDIGHFFADILPWVAFGNDDDDPGPIANEFIRLFE